jgi:ribosomal protein S18 acetylase RimI-like enzyme
VSAESFPPSGETLRLRVELAGPQAEASWPSGIAVRTFRPEDAAAVHALLEHGYRRGGGTVDAYETWLPLMMRDAEFDPEVWFLAEAGGELAGAALCWTSAFVKDLVVHESWRRRGLGEALLRHAFGVFAGRGATRVELKVEAANAGALRLYERVGMSVVERLEPGR